SKKGSTPMSVKRVMALAASQVARSKIGGQTGDVLGAVQVLTEIAALAAATALLP
ncbi:MAG: Cobalamin-5-phosphate synthase, partial [Pseudomonadota bacterium]